MSHEMRHDPDDSSLHEILSAVCDETATAEQIERLAERLRSDAAARRLYVRYLDMRGRLNTKLAEADAAADEPRLQGSPLWRWPAVWGGFNTPDDGANLGWKHWVRDGKRPPALDNLCIDILPDVSKLAPEARHATALVGSDGRPVELSSSFHPQTVDTHFRWMKEYGIGGVFVRCLLRMVGGVVAVAACLPVAAAETSEPLAVYTGKIRPLLAERCFSCHGGLKQEAGLRLDTVALMTEGGESGSVVTRGDPAQSLILERVSDTGLPPLNGTASRERIWGWSKPREAINATRKEGTG